MSACSPQRFLPNNLNALRTAVLSAVSLPVDNQVLALPYPRSGTAQATLSGSYTGDEQADYDVQIVDTDVTIPRVSIPTFEGAGSGTITGITASGAQQVYTATLSNAGTDTTAASVQLEGATIRALVEGAGGNDIRIIVDQSSLVFTASNYSTIADLTAGQGGENSPLLGQGSDWDAAVLDGNGLIPSTAHRVAFGDDRSTVYLSYKEFAGGIWNYHLVPALARDVPKGTPIYFVTDGRTVTVTDGAETENYPDIATAYDLLNALRTTSALVVVDGVVANDRTPTGQAARELALRTDAHAEISSGTGSTFAKGVDNVTVASTAGTQLVTLTCFAVNSGDHPLARLGAERWQAKSSLLGDLGTVVSGIVYREPSGAFSFTVPVRLPIGYGAPKGRFSLTGIDYASPTTQAPICPASLSLGPDAVDQTITLIYTARPSGDCDCSHMPRPNLITSCLGDPREGGAMSAYQDDTITRLIALWAWYTATVRAVTSMGSAGSEAAAEADMISNPTDGSVITPGTTTGFAQATESLKTVVNNFEAALAQIDPLAESSPPTLRAAGCTAWDTAFTELQGDIDGSPTPSRYNIPSDRYDARLNWVLISAGISPLGGADANTIVSGDGCWRDYGGSAYWTVEGSAKGGYAPLFTNKPYYSTRGNANGAIFSTHEFALILNVKCPERLQLGDRVTLEIRESGYGATYQVGDELILPIVAAAPLYLTGGRTGDPTQTWNVNGSVSGPLPAYTFDPDTPLAYSQPTLGFLLAEGGIKWAQGDQFRFAVEGGHYRWRKDGGAWIEASPLSPIPLGADLLDEGLSVAFTAGAAASFVAGDIFKFRALQPWAVSNLQTPSAAVYKWPGAAATVYIDLGSIQQLDLVAMLHGLPEGAGVVLWGGSDATAVDWSEALTWRGAVSIRKSIDRATRYLRLEITAATGGWLQWLWAGVPLTTTLSSEVQLRRGYLLNRPGGNLQGGRYKGKTVSGDVSWTEAALLEADVLALAAMLDHVKANNDEPILFIPQVTRTDEAMLYARIASDEVDFPDHAAYNQNAGIARRVSASIPLQGVWQ